MLHETPAMDPQTALQLRQLGDAIRDCRRELRLSQEDFAELTEMHRTHVSEVESGAVNPSFHLISRVARARGITIAELMARAGV